MEELVRVGGNKWEELVRGGEEEVSGRNCKGKNGVVIGRSRRRGHLADI